MQSNAQIKPILFILAVLIAVAAIYFWSKDEPPYDPVHAEQVKKGIAEYLGKGYKGYQYYASPESCTFSLFDLTDPAVVDIQDAPKWEGRFASGENKTEFYDEFFAKASVSGVYDGFSGEITSTFNKSTLKNRTHSFATANIAQTYYRLTVLDTAPLKKEVAEDLMQLEANALFDKYGTHYLKSIYIGGRIGFSSFADRSKVTETFNLQATVDASYLEIVKGSASAGTVNKKDIEIVSRNKRIIVKGGDPAKAANVQDGLGEPAESYNAWAASVPDFMSISDIADNGMVPIYELVNDSDRREVLKAAWKVYMEAHTDDVLKEGEAKVITKSDSFRLKGEDGRYYGAAPYVRGESYYYPTIANTGQILQLDSGKEALETGHNVKIKTVEKFDGSWADYVYLGAFGNKHELYYWITKGYEAKTNWYIERVVPASDPRIRYGDTVKIRNQDYEQYLTPTPAGYLTTIGVAYTWTILAK
ncbi:MAG: hypothetical protein COA83_06520 [Methylophaga sp.]|nr:MAG: hypothetical protein COA83_06520 [Methylophaga sp.]